MSEGVDKYGAEYKRTKNDFKIRRLEQDNCVCNICHGTGAKFEVEYITRNYESARRKGKICKELQAHGHRIWICQECAGSFKKAIAALYMAPVQCNLLKVDSAGRVCCVKDTCDGCPHVPGQCAIEDLVRDAGLFDSWGKWDFPTFREREEQEKFYKEDPETTRRKFLEIMKQGNT